MSLINREDAMEAIEREQSLIERPITETRWFDLGLRKAQDVIKNLPSAQPERKLGKWIDEGTNYFCSECYRGCWVNSDYCPWCGARMVGEEG